MKPLPARGPSGPAPETCYLARDPSPALAAARLMPERTARPAAASITPLSRPESEGWRNEIDWVKAQRVGLPTSGSGEKAWFGKWGAPAAMNGADPHEPQV